MKEKLKQSHYNIYGSHEYPFDISYRCPWRVQCPRPGKNGGCALQQVGCWLWFLTNLKGTFYKLVI